jgi:hypothetical protein
MATERRSARRSELHENALRLRFNAQQIELSEFTGGAIGEFSVGAI